VVNIADIKLLSMNKEVKAYEAPAEAIITGGVKIKIKDLLEYGGDNELKARSNI
jgi:hypothetical protein